LQSKCFEILFYCASFSPTPTCALRISAFSARSAVGFDFGFPPCSSVASVVKVLVFGCGSAKL
jgi:hypothetical protein